MLTKTIEQITEPTIDNFSTIGEFESYVKEAVNLIVGTVDYRIEENRVVLNDKNTLYIDASKFVSDNLNPFDSVHDCTIIYWAIQEFFDS